MNLIKNIKSGLAKPDPHAHACMRVHTLVCERFKTPTYSGAEKDTVGRVEAPPDDDEEASVRWRQMSKCDLKLCAFVIR